MRFSKDEYILRTLSKIKYKKWKLFVITSIVHFLNDPDIEFFCQQLVKGQNGNRYLPDLCFPSLKIYYEREWDVALLNDQKHYGRLHPSPSRSACAHPSSTVPEGQSAQCNTSAHRAWPRRGRDHAHCAEHAAPTPDPGIAIHQRTRPSPRVPTDGALKRSSRSVYATRDVISIRLVSVALLRTFRRFVASKRIVNDEVTEGLTAIKRL